MAELPYNFVYGKVGQYSMRRHRVISKVWLLSLYWQTWGFWYGCSSEPLLVLVPENISWFLRAEKKSVAGKSKSPVKGHLFLSA